MFALKVHKREFTRESSQERERVHKREFTRESSQERVHKREFTRESKCPFCCCFYAW